MAKYNKKDTGADVDDSVLNAGDTQPTIEYQFKEEKRHVSFAKDDMVVNKTYHDASTNLRDYQAGQSPQKSPGILKGHEKGNGLDNDEATLNQKNDKQVRSNS